MLRSLSHLRSPPNPPLCIGFLAGIQSSGPSAPFSDFDDAYDLLQGVLATDASVIDCYEKDLWRESPRQKFVHSTKAISVIDTEIVGASKHRGAIRSLIHNRNPHLIQSSIIVPQVSAPGPASAAPPPLTGLASTHLGGLALALPLFQCVQEKTPTIAICGAGGCSLPRLLAHHGAIVSCCEPCPDTIFAATRFFGADDSFTIQLDDSHSFLSKSRDIDVLIIDAADSDAPPLSMRESNFWSSIVRPSLSLSGSIVATNFIGDLHALDNFLGILREVLDNHDTFAVSPPAEAGVSDRHKLLFAIPKNVDLSAQLMEKVVGKGYLDSEEKWLEMIAVAVAS